MAPIFSLCLVHRSSAIAAYIRQLSASSGSVTAAGSGPHGRQRFIRARQSSAHFELSALKLLHHLLHAITLLHSKIQTWTKRYCEKICTMCSFSHYIRGARLVEHTTAHHMFPNSGSPNGDSLSSRSIVLDHVIDFIMREAVGGKGGKGHVRWSIARRGLWALTVSGKSVATCRPLTYISVTSLANSCIDQAKHRRVRRGVDRKTTTHRHD